MELKQQAGRRGTWDEQEGQHEAETITKTKKKEGHVAVEIPSCEQQGHTAHS